MFKLNEKYEVNRNILKCDYIRYSTSEICTTNTANYQKYINVHREGSVTSLLNSYLNLNSDVWHAATKNRYAHGNDIMLVNLGPIALCSNYRLTPISGKHLEDISHARIVSLLYILITGARDTDNLSIGFDRDRGRRQQELTKKNQKGKCHVRITLKDKFGFAEHQKKATYGLGYKLKLTRYTDNAVLKKDNPINIGKIKNFAIEWYVPRFIPSIPQQALLSKQIISKTPTEFQFVERIVLWKN